MEVIIIQQKLDIPNLSSKKALEVAKCLYGENTDIAFYATDFANTKMHYVLEDRESASKLLEEIAEEDITFVVKQGKRWGDFDLQLPYHDPKKTPLEHVEKYISCIQLFGTGYSGPQISISKREIPGKFLPGSNDLILKVAGYHPDLNEQALHKVTSFFRQYHL